MRLFKQWSNYGKMGKFSVLFCSTLLFLSSVSFGATIVNLGVVGAVYPVVEPDILKELHQRAVKHGLTKKQILRKVNVYQPVDIQNLPRAEKDTSFLADMTYSLTKDYRDKDGKIVYPKGFTFNPLDHISFPGGMVIINAADPEQVKWFKNSPYFNNHSARLLISDGYAFPLTRKFKRPVFYLTKQIAQRIKVRHVPAVVVQQGKKLLVHEVKIKRK